VAPGGSRTSGFGRPAEDPARIVQITLLNRNETTRKGVTLSTIREAWFCVLQDADGNAEDRADHIVRLSAAIRGREANGGCG
jgi:hypothetical protein